MRRCGEANVSPLCCSPEKINTSSELSAMRFHFSEIFDSHLSHACRTQKTRQWGNVTSAWKDNEILGNCAWEVNKEVNIEKVRLMRLFFRKTAMSPLYDNKMGWIEIINRLAVANVTTPESHQTLSDDLNDETQASHSLVYRLLLNIRASSDNYCQHMETKRHVGISRIT